MHGRLRRCGDRGPARPGVAGRHRRPRRHRHRRPRSTTPPRTSSAGGADLVVMLVHEGAPNTDCDSMDDDPARRSATSSPASVRRRRDRLRAHAPGLQLLVPRGRVGTSGPDRDRSTGRLRRAVRQQPQPARVHRRRRRPATVLGEDPGDPAARRSPTPTAPDPRCRQSLYPADPAVETIVADAVAEANELGAVPLGDVERPVRPGPLVRRRTATTPDTRSRHRREPRRRVDARQPGRRGAALGHRAGGVRRRRDRVHEPRRPARQHGGPDGDLPSGRGRAAVREHAGQHGPHRCADQDGPGAAVAARRRRATSRAGRSCGSARPTGFEYSYDPSLPEGSPDHRDLAERRADRRDASRTR